MGFLAERYKNEKREKKIPLKGEKRSYEEKREYLDFGLMKKIEEKVELSWNAKLLQDTFFFNVMTHFSLPKFPTSYFSSSLHLQS